MAATHQTPRGDAVKASLAVHSFNEGPALERLILSSLDAAHAFDEWVVLDHRSSDDTQGILDALEPLLAAYGVRLTRLHEHRDLSANLTFADVRNRTVQAASNDIVALMDADFVLGRAFTPALETTLTRFRRNPRLAVARFRIPILWDHLRTDEHGRIVEHGRHFRHGYSHRILRKSVVHYRQDGNEGRWEKLHYRGGRVDLRNEDGNILVSLNIKPRERIERRATMTEFMRSAMHGEIAGEWLQHDIADLPTQPPYAFSEDLIRATLNLANLDVRE